MGRLQQHYSHIDLFITELSLAAEFGAIGLRCFQTPADLQLLRDILSMPDNIQNSIRNAREGS